MATGSIIGVRSGEAWAALARLVGDEGSRVEPHLHALLRPGAAARDLADAAHCLCMLHGRHPGVLELAADHVGDVAAADWLARAADVFADERALLVRLVAGVGPLPSTPGQAESEAAIAGQRHALDMIAASDRAGCALGAAVALLLDWAAIRDVLDVVALRIGLPARVSALPTAMEVALVVAPLATTPSFDRAMRFGAQQTLAQHRALWQLLDARAGARD